MTRNYLEQVGRRAEIDVATHTHPGWTDYMEIHAGGFPLPEAASPSFSLEDLLDDPVSTREWGINELE